MLKFDKYLIGMFAAIFSLIATLSFQAHPTEMTVTEDCLASSCYLILSGNITEKTLPEIQRKSKSLEGNLVVLESLGGSLQEALKIGRFFRENNMRTHVGRLFDDTDTEGVANKCLSACAYAFLGGINREVGKHAKLGFHRFSFGTQGEVLIPADTALNAAQDISAELVAYVISMNVDARLFNDASKTPSNEMLYPDRKTLLEYSVITPGRFSSFFLEPYGKGIVAASKRLHWPHQFANLSQLTAFCRNGAPRLLFTISNEGLTDYGVKPLTIETTSTAKESFSIEASKMSVKIVKNATIIEVELGAEATKAILNARSVFSEFAYPNAAGGQAEFKLDFTSKDRSFLDAAFRLCI